MTALTIMLIAITVVGLVAAELWLFWRLDNRRR